MKWSENKGKISELYSSGVSMSEIRKQFPMRYSRKMLTYLKDRNIAKKLKNGDIVSENEIADVRNKRLMDSVLFEHIEKIKSLYSEGLSASEIKEIIRVPISVRSIQRYIGLLGMSRTVGDAFRLANSRGRIDRSHLIKERKAGEFRKSISTKTRYFVLNRDNFSCVDCGFTAKDGKLLDMDHIIRPEDGGDNSIDNLVTRCRECNIGRYLIEQKHKKV
jgi:5-methylcytosine-specific restriction endonuclease McrA